jgi:hypothetical protein
MLSPAIIKGRSELKRTPKQAPNLSCLTRSSHRAQEREVAVYAVAPGYRERRWISAFRQSKWS